MKSSELMNNIQHVYPASEIIKFINLNEKDIDFDFVDEKGDTFAHKCLIATSLMLAPGSGLMSGSNSHSYDNDALLKIFPLLAGKGKVNFNKKNHAGGTSLDVVVGTHCCLPLLKLLLENGAHFSECKNPKAIFSILLLRKSKENEDICNGSCRPEKQQETNQELKIILALIKQDLEKSPVDLSVQLQIDSMIERLNHFIQETVVEDEWSNKKLAQLIRKIKGLTQIEKGKDALILKFKNNNYVNEYLKTLASYGVTTPYAGSKYLNIPFQSSGKVLEKMMEETLLVDSAPKETLQLQSNLPLFQSKEKTSDQLLRSSKLTSEDFKNKLINEAKVPGLFQIEQDYFANTRLIFDSLKSRDNQYHMWANIKGINKAIYPENCIEVSNQCTSDVLEQMMNVKSAVTYKR